MEKTSFASCSKARNSVEGCTPSSKYGLYLLDHGDLDVTTEENEEALLAEETMKFDVVQK